MGAMRDTCTRRSSSTESAFGARLYTSYLEGSTIAVGRVARGNLTPGLPQNPCVTVSRYTALAVLVIWRAGFTQSQWAKYRGLSAAASDQARMAFFQVRCFLYLFISHRIR